MMRRFALCGVLAMLVPAAPFVAPARAQEAPADSAAAVTRTELQEHLDGFGEILATMQADLDKLKRFKFSGYLQARTELGEASNDSVRVSGNPYAVSPANVSRFYIRRARLKLTYDSSPLSQAVIYLDGGQDRTIRLLEAYVTLLDPWTPLHDHQLTVGQFNVPFGYEIERSSSVRELPERSRAENVLFAGERDRGVKLESQWTPQLKTSLSVLNGGGINSADFPNTDPTRGKDVTARARWSQGVFDVSASGYWGRHVTPLTGLDVTTDKTRLGLDAQTFYQLPRLGGGTLRAEWYSGHEINPDSVKTLVVAPTDANKVRLLKAGANAAHLASDAQGGYVMWVQNVGDPAQAVVRWDWFDPNVDADHDQYARLTVGANWFWDGYTRLTVAYDVPLTDVANGPGRWRDPHDDLWTFQVQHKF